MIPQSPSRFPAEPAKQAIRRFGRRHALSIAQTATVLAIDPRLLRSVMGRRWLEWETADAIAVALRRHPLDLWPDWLGTRSHGTSLVPHRDATLLRPDAGRSDCNPSTGEAAR